MDNEIKTPNIDAGWSKPAPPADPLRPHDREARRPVVPMRSAAADYAMGKDKTKTSTKQLNPFDELQSANRENMQLIERLQALCNKLVGSTPAFGDFDEPETEPQPDGLMPLAAHLAKFIQERSRHGVSLIDKIEEHLG